MSSREAEKEYLRRAGDSRWERLKPFAPPGEIAVGEGLPLIQDFGAAVALLDVQPHHRVLDLAGGSCWAADWLQRLGVTVVAADLSIDLLTVGRSRLAASGPARVACGDAEALPFRDGAFDRVICLNAMHHIPRVERALGEIVRVLAADGRAVFSEPGAGHAAQPHARRAVEDFGVQEADIDAAAFLRQCRAAGFADAVLEPFARIAPGHGLTAEHWTAWWARAAAPRPLRAMRTFRRAVLELFGARKDDEMFQDAFASEALRVLGAGMRDHPIVVASKQPLERFLRRAPDRRPTLAAVVRLLDGPAAVSAGAPFVLTVEARNDGAVVWRAAPDSRGYVRVGVELLDEQHRLIDRDFVRAPLPQDVPPGATVRVNVRCSSPAAPGMYVLKIDLVSEGVSWFEPHGTAAAVHPLRVSGSNRV